MAHTTDWIPHREQDLVDLCGRWKRILSDSANVTAYGWDQAEVTAILAEINPFLTARAACEADDSPAKRLIKDEAKGEAIDAMRDFANSSVRHNKKIPAGVKLALGLRPADPNPTPHRVPGSQPETVVENRVNHYEHKVRALNRGRKDTSKPADAYAWQVSAGNAPPPARPSPSPISAARPAWSSPTPKPAKAARARGPR